MTQPDLHYMLGYFQAQNKEEKLYDNACWLQTKCLLIGLHTVSVLNEKKK